MAEDYRVFKQDKVAYLEQETAGYNMVMLVSLMRATMPTNKITVWFLKPTTCSIMKCIHMPHSCRIFHKVGLSFTVGVEFGF